MHTHLLGTPHPFTAVAYRVDCMSQNYLFNPNINACCLCLVDAINIDEWTSNIFGLSEALTKG